MNETDFTLIITHSDHNDSVVRQLADENEVIFFKLEYVPMYNEFNEIKKMQLQMQDKDLFNKGKSYISIDISEWVGHEFEEYFIITLKFLSDHTYKWHYFFTVGNNKREKIRLLFGSLKCYLVGDIHEDIAFNSKEDTGLFLQSAFKLRRGSAGLLSGILSENQYAQHMSDIFIEAIVTDLQRFSKKAVITQRDIIDYITNKDTILNIIGGNYISDKYKKTPKEGECDDEL